MKKQGTFLGMPYNWQRPTWKEIKKRIWNKTSHTLFVPRAYGWGYTINLYALVHRRKKLLAVCIALVVMFIAFSIQRMQVVAKAHSTFENYYAFRGCTRLVKKTATYGLCTVSSGHTIKIVEFQGRWYLDGDLPLCISHICF